MQFFKDFGFFLCEWAMLCIYREEEKKKTNETEIFRHD